MQMSFRSTVRSMIGNIKKLSCQELVCGKKQVLQDPGYVRGVKGPCCMLHAILKGCMNIIPIHKVTFKKFIYHIGGVKRSVHIHE